MLSCWQQQQVSMLPCVSRNLPLRCLTPVGVARETAPHASLAFCAAEIQAETEPPTTSAATQRAGAILLTLWWAQITVPRRIIWNWYTRSWRVGCDVWYSEDGTGRGCSPPMPLLPVPNVTAHLSTASVPITVLLYNGPLLCGFNVPIKGLIAVLSVVRTQKKK